ETVSQFINLGIDVFAEQGAGDRAYSPDDYYIKAGAKVCGRDEVLSKCGMITSINRPSEADILKTQENAIVLSLFYPFTNLPLVKLLIEKKITAFSLELMPRTTRAQTMDVLSSQATVAGYKAVLLAANHLPKFFPMLMTAAGSVRPAKVLVLGAGVAGLMAIGTARRLGAVVEAFDTRSAVKEEVQSLGAKFIEVEGAREDLSAGGYAVEQTEEFQKKQKEKIKEHAVNADVIITTAQIPGRRAPVLITRETVEEMKPGSVIIDLAASTGGNCELTENNKTTTVKGVTIIGNSNLPSEMPVDSSRMYSRNLLNFLKLILRDGNPEIDFSDELVRGTCITHNGEIINEKLKAKINGTDI
ncbi:MAG: Re/Si-specific NAD(P)(+) transhydrogenase subunit alpha, partial [Ignavibacteria bacterium]|nr:Re/Si-specific NAD(P)(+) transhydrogenase subunit alpha [Ignavibacteria bacterium]